MILFTILVIMVLIVVLLISTAGAIGIWLSSDLIVCIAIIAFIIWLRRRKKHKK